MTSGYQAEFGRASGIQITAVTKSGTNSFHGSGYDIAERSRWNSVSWVNQQNGTAPGVNNTDTLGYTLGGPVGRPGGANKLFFFYGHEFRPHAVRGHHAAAAAADQCRAQRRLHPVHGQPRQLDHAQGALREWDGAHQRQLRQRQRTDALPEHPVVVEKRCRRRAEHFTVPRDCGETQLQLRDDITRREGSSATAGHPDGLSVLFQIADQRQVRGQRQRVQVTPGTALPGFNDTLQKYPFIHTYRRR